MFGGLDMIYVAEARLEEMRRDLREPASTVLPRKRRGSIGHATCPVFCRCLPPMWRGRLCRAAEGPRHKVSFHGRRARLPCNRARCPVTD